jgi:prepilin-type N-terminal cleavage/methylation domain-containing protein
MRTSRGFTLLETLLAVALAAALLVAVNFFVLSMGELWGGGSEVRLFDRHVRGVTRFLESLVQQSVVPTTTSTATLPDGTMPKATPQTRLAPPSGLARFAALIFGDGIRHPVTVGTVTGPRVGFLLASLATRTEAGSSAQPPSRQGGAARIPEQVRTTGTNRTGTGAANSSADASSQDATGDRFRIATPAGYDGAPPMLMFEVDEAPGQCVWPVRPLPQVECALQINADEGLVLLWKSKLEEDYGKGRPRKTQLSPFGQTVAFEYYDADRKSWTLSQQPQSDGNGGWLVPQRLRLTFVNGPMKREVSIVLPGAPGGAPLR